MTIVRENLMQSPEYRPYVGCEHMARAYFSEGQFCCPMCDWKSGFEQEFIQGWLAKHNRPAGFSEPRIYRRH